MLRNRETQAEALIHFLSLTTDALAIVNDERDRYRAALDAIVNGECYSLDAALAIARAALDGER